MSPVKLLAQALVATILAAPGAAVAAGACDDGRAVEVVRAQSKRDGVDVSDLQLAVEGPYGRAKFTRTHPTFPASPALKRKLANRTFYFVWFHPPFRGSGARGTDVWALVGATQCDMLHLARAR